MKNLTPKQLLKLENQIGLLAHKLAIVCQQHKIADRNMDLVDAGFDDWDAETQEGMVNELHNMDRMLDTLHCRIIDLRENQGA
jgi:hypothetical protein